MRRQCFAAIFFFFYIVASCRAEYWLYAASAQDATNSASHSHTFATFIKTDDRTGKEVDRQTISWMPRSMNIKVLRKIPEPGINLTIPQTLKWAKSVGDTVTIYGPYRISEDLYNRAKKKVEDLNSGKVKYIIRDRGRRPVACNCIHAIADLYAENGLLLTGTTRGDLATKLVIQHLRPFIRR